MRDIVLTLFIAGAIPVAVVHPVVGIYLWTWLSIMNPHRLTWGFSYDLPFALCTALATMIGVLVTRDQRRLPIAAPTLVLALFTIWMSAGYPFSLFPLESVEMWTRVLKIQVMTLLAAALIVKPEHVKRLIWVLVVSLGFYGVKGGLFTLATAGAYRVWGPAGSFIEGNNEVALALIIAIPLMWYLFEVTTKRWVRNGLLAVMLLSALASIGSYSRGALVAFAAMSITIWLYSRRKAMLGIGLLACVPLILAFMPDVWEARMKTISNYEMDASAMGRLNAWRMAWNLALDRPLFGGGFGIYNQAVFSSYAPIPEDIHAAHSIYFQVLGEHGFVGLFLFLLLWWLTWRTAVWIREHTTSDGKDSWAFHLAAMSQVSLIGFFVGGAFLSLAYFDLPYYIMVALVATKWILVREREGLPTKTSVPLDTALQEGGALRPPPAGRNLASNRGDNAA